MAFNSWPFETQPPWSKAIEPASHTGKRARHHDPAWMVWLRSLTIELVPNHSRRPWQEAGAEPLLHLDFVDYDHPHGISMLLDTGIPLHFPLAQKLRRINVGTSTSDLPLRHIQRMHEVLGGRTDKIPIPHRGQHTRETYHISQWFLDRKSQVKFEFVGDPDEPPIVVYGPTEPFVFLNEILPSGPVERSTVPTGLIFPTLSDDGICILGLVRRLVPFQIRHLTEPPPELLSEHVCLLVAKKGRLEPRATSSTVA